MANNERTFIMCKPDAVHRGIVGEIIKRFEAKGFKLVGMKFMWVSWHKNIRDLIIFRNNLKEKSHWNRLRVWQNTFKASVIVLILDR